MNNMINDELFAYYIGAFVGIIAYIIMGRYIILGEKGYSFTSFTLFSILNGISAVTIYLEQGNYLLSLIFSLSAATIAVMLLLKRKVTWSWIESLVIGLITISFILWYLYGAYVGIWASTLSLLIAIIPQVKDMYKLPSNKVAFVNKFFIASSFISCFSAKSFTFVELSFPVTILISCSIIYYFAAGHHKN